MCFGEWHGSYSSTSINKSSIAPHKAGLSPHLWVDDADGGFVPHVSLVSLCRRSIEP